MPQHDDPTKPSTASHSASLTPSERAALIEHHPDEQTQLDVHPDEFGGSDDGSHYMSQTSAAKLRKGGATPTDEQPIQLDPFGGVYYDLRGRETIMCRDLGSHQTPHEAAQPKPATLTATELAATAAIAARSGVIINVVERGAPIMPGWYMSKAKPSWVFPGGEADWTPRKVVRADLAGSAELLVPASAEGEAPTTWHRLDLFEWGARTSPPGFGLARLEAITNRTPTAPNPTGRHVDDPPQLESERRAHEQAARRKAGLDPEFVSPIRGVDGSTPLTDAINGEREPNRLQCAVHVAISTWVLATLAFTSSAPVRAVDLILGVLLRGIAGRDLELVGVRDAASRIGDLVASVRDAASRIVDLVASPQHESAEVFKAICALLTGLDKAIVAELLGLPGLPASAPPHLEPIHAPVQGLVSDAAARPLPGKGEAGEPAEMARERQHAELLAKSLPEIPRPLVDDLQSVRGKLDWSNDAQAREQAVVNAISDWLLDTDPRRHVLEVDRLLQNYLHQYVRWGDVEPANLTELAYQISSHFDGRSEAEVNASRNLQRALVNLAESMLPQDCRGCPHATFTVHDDQGRTACKLLAGKQVSAGSMPLGRPSNCPLTALDTVRSEGVSAGLEVEHPERMCDDCRAARNLAPLANAHAPTRWNVPDDHVWVLEHVVRMRREHEATADSAHRYDPGTLPNLLAEIVRSCDSNLLEAGTPAFLLALVNPTLPELIEPHHVRPAVEQLVRDTKPDNTSSWLWIGIAQRERPWRVHGRWLRVENPGVGFLDARRAREQLGEAIVTELERRRPDRERECAEPHPTEPGHYWARSPGWSESADDASWERTPWGHRGDLVVEVGDNGSHGEPTDDLLWWCAEKGEWRPLDQLIWGPRVTTPSEQAMHETLWASICEALDIPPASTIDNVLARIDHLKPNF